ncbi:hypothetical protein B0O80DRAFT_427061 [Mortierella sp. GBAus27b]|nr:hypothetical protein B0O80DRAFT_427061 [Mortierella sp. GBAus27b]
MFNSSSSLRGASSPRKDLELANALLESAKKAEDPQLSSTICSDAETKLSHMKRTAKKALVNPISDDDRSLRTSAATAYLDLGKQWAIVGKQDKALKCLKTAESYGAKIPPLDQLVPPPQQSGKMKSTKDLTATIEKTATVKQEIPVFPSHIFAENKQPPTSQIDLPTQDERLNSTPQLAHCLGLLQVWMTSPDDVTDLTTRTWLKDIENDEDEKERLNTLASDLLRAFVNDEIKDHKAVAEVVCLASVLQKDNFRYLLRQFYDGVDQSDMLNVNQLEGLAQIVQGASPSYLDPDDLVKILKLLNTRLQDTHGQSPHHIYRLTESRVWIANNSMNHCQPIWRA